jgi:AP-3 complex subunit mu
LQSYFGSPLDEGAIKENFSTVYQLLEEMNDHGYPLTTEPNALEAMIMKPTVISKIQQVVTGSSTVSSRLPDGTVSNMPWRRSNVRYAQNEIYVDLVEEVRESKERSDELTTRSQAAQIARACTSIPDAPPP